MQEKGLGADEFEIAHKRSVKIVILGRKLYNEEEAIYDG
jgi:hypothetical protein